MKTSSLEAKLAYARCEWSKPNGGKEVVFLSPIRGLLYDDCNWCLTDIRLSTLTISWPMGMGYRKWAKGSLPRIAAKFRRRKDRKDKIWRLVSSLRSGLEFPPIIVIRNTASGKFHIDDGCHRAVALYLLGTKRTKAFIGNPRHDWNPK